MALKQVCARMSLLTVRGVADQWQTVRDLGPSERELIP